MVTFNIDCCSTNVLYDFTLVEEPIRYIPPLHIGINQVIISKDIINMNNYLFCL